MTKSSPPDHSRSGRREGAAAAAGPASAFGARGARTLWLALVVLASLWAAGAFAPGMGGWGFNVLRFSPPVPGWTIWAASALLLVPALARPIAHALERAGESRRLRLALTLAWVAGAAALAWGLPDRVAFTGDFLLRQGAALDPLPPRHVFPQALPLDVALHYHLLRLAIGAGLASTETAARVLGALEAASLAGLGLAFARALGLRDAAGLAAASIVLFGGWLGLFTGYSKAFTELVVLEVAIAVIALRALPAGAGLPWLGVALALAFALHRSALAFIPAGVLALVMGARARGAAGARSPGVIAAVAMPLGVLVALSPWLVRTLTGFDWAHHMAPPQVLHGGGLWGAALAPLHLLDLVNLVALLAPVALLLPALVLAAGRGLLRGPEGRLLLALAVPQLVLMLLVHPSQGAFRDWDVFAPAGVALALLASLAVVRILGASPAYRWLGVSVAAAVAAPATLWLVHAADFDRGLDRVVAFASEAPVRSEVERGLTWEFLGTSANVHGRTELAADAMGHAAALTPSARVIMEWGMAEAARGDYGMARRAFEQAAARDPTQQRIWMNLVNTCMRLDDLAGARRAAQQLVRLMPGNAPAAQMLAEIERREAAQRREDPR
jgi:cytochrome c-type biogenesis protein CcmH/NrfG